MDQARSPPSSGENSPAHDVDPDAPQVVAPEVDPDDPQVVAPEVDPDDPQVIHPDVVEVMNRDREDPINESPSEDTMDYLSSSFSSYSEESDESGCVVVSPESTDETSEFEEVSGDSELLEAVVEVAANVEVHEAAEALEEVGPLEDPPEMGKVSDDADDEASEDIASNAQKKAPKKRVTFAENLSENNNLAEEAGSLKEKIKAAKEADFLENKEDDDPPRKKQKIAKQADQLEIGDVSEHAMPPEDKKASEDEEFLKFHEGLLEKRDLGPSADQPLIEERRDADMPSALEVAEGLLPLLALEDLDDFDDEKGPSSKKSKRE